MTIYTDISKVPHDPADPDPWLAMYMDTSVPVLDEVKKAWISNLRSRTRQFLLPVLRPLAHVVIILLQLWKVLLPKAFTSSALLHRMLVWGLKTWVRPEANWLILRHFHIGSQNLAFIARNVPGVSVPLSPLMPRRIEDLIDHVFLRHDINLFNFVINLNRDLREKNIEIGKIEHPDFRDIDDVDMRIEDLPNRWTNFLDLETAIDLFTPVYSLFLSDHDFWRATNSLQMDEPIAIYAAKILGQPEHLVLLNNKHPLVPLTTLRAGHRLVLHGLSSEMLYTLLVRKKRQAAA
ncbi:DUF6999 family protein [Ramlibacter tataouinensis]|uniref:Uncharacterized protein n=1 Tax=Ramlibacter tataouinensis (strain ATCC BAA-407 / DSM 14655 / LMG 21543 / TTB310) TaxID=365046 RepID=F5Y5X8_RAMTT|nr:hypothetical protein [Ramlibacter tataouinensis]AEG91482.1 Conserved hypothetical protein [Ramlibacter tataouinensis TTB310]